MFVQFDWNKGDGENMVEAAGDDPDATGFQIKSARAIHVHYSIE